MSSRGGWSTLADIRAGAPLTEMTVLDALEEAIKEADPELEVSRCGGPGSEKLAIRRGDSYTGEAALGNLWSMLRGKSGEEAASLIERHAAVTSEASGSIDAPQWNSEESLMPCVQGRSFVEAASRRTEGGEVAHRLLTGYGSQPLYLCLAYDFPTHLAYAVGGKLPPSLPDFESAEQKAVSNLGSYLTGLQLSVSEKRLEGTTVGTGELVLYQLQLDGNYDASLVLLPGILDYLASKAGNPLSSLESVSNMVFALPSRDRLMVADARDAMTCRLLASASSIGVSSTAYPISGSLYRYTPESLSQTSGQTRNPGPVTLKEIP